MLYECEYHSVAILICVLSERVSSRLRDHNTQEILTKPNQESICKEHLILVLQTKQQLLKTSSDSQLDGYFERLRVLTMA